MSWIRLRTTTTTPKSKTLASGSDWGEDSDIAEISIEDGESTETTVSPRTERLLKKEDQHVSFVSPMKEATTAKKYRRGRK